MSPGFAIRPATPTDVGQILQFIRDLAEYEKSPNSVVATEASLHEALFGERPPVEAVIADDGGKPVGFALFFHNYSTWTGWRGIYLEDLYVAPKARGSGTGKALLSHVARLAVERGCARFEWAVLDWNTPAIGFYKKLGAKPMDEWTVMRLTGDALAKVAAGA
ncbi:GNAT family N-acetyltransferase [Sphingosinicellaceae bacterium]|nr:GNAT family N-acetyltransferase [Sphingosinicellaceae bacterium]